MTKSIFTDETPVDAVGGKRRVTGVWVMETAWPRSCAGAQANPIPSEDAVCLTVYIKSFSNLYFGAAMREGKIFRLGFGGTATSHRALCRRCGPDAKVGKLRFVGSKWGQNLPLGANASHPAVSLPVLSKYFIRLLMSGITAWNYRWFGPCFRRADHLPPPSR